MVQPWDFPIGSIGLFYEIDINFAGERRVLNSELWHACAGPLVSLPAVGTRVVYFPQGHSEQVTKLLHDINLFCLLSSEIHMISHLGFDIRHLTMHLIVVH